MLPALFLLAGSLGFPFTTFAWTIPNIQLPTFTYQCMPMELSWRDGSPPYTIWFDPADGPAGASPRPGFAVWHNLTGQNYLVPCKAPTGSILRLVLKDGTGWISVSLGTFVVLPSSESSCLKISNDAGLAQSQPILSTMLESFQQSVVSAISVSATAIAAPTASLHSVSSPESSIPFTTATPLSESPERKEINLAQIIGPVLGCFFGILIGVGLSICYIRRKRQRYRPNADTHIPLSSTTAFDLLDGESRHRSESETRPTRANEEEGSATIHEDDTMPVSAPRSRLQLHDGAALGRSQSEKRSPPSTSSQSNPASSLPTVEDTDRADTNERSQPQTHSHARDRNLEERAEELSAPELERLAALVARRLERVRGAPPQYRATDEN